MDIQEGLLHSTGCAAYAQTSAAGVLDVSAQVLGGLFQLLTVALFSFYFAADGPGCAVPCARCCRPRARPRCCARGEIAVDKTGGYLYCAASWRSSPG